MTTFSPHFYFIFLLYFDWMGEMPGLGRRCGWGWQHWNEYVDLMDFNVTIDVWVNEGER